MLGNNIKKIRLEKEISLNETARRAGITGGYLSSIENNKRTNVGSDILQSIADVLGVPVNDFYNTTPIENKECKNNTSEVLDDEIRAIARDMQKLSTGKRDLLKQLIKTMSESADEELKK